MKKLIMSTVILSTFLLFSGCGQNIDPISPTPDSTPDITSPDTSPDNVDITTDTPEPSPDTPEPTPGNVDTSPDVPDPTPENVVTSPYTSPTVKHDAIPFRSGQLYAVAYLGYQTPEDLDYYADRYLDSDDLPIHYFSDGDYYLVIPRYEGMSLSLYVNDIETSLSTLRFADPNCGPFILQCNVSDIFADVTLRLEYKAETVEFSPFISLKDGELMIGERGLDLTKPRS